jgi:hypothetical protein
VRASLKGRLILGEFEGQELGNLAAEADVFGAVDDAYPTGT